MNRNRRQETSKRLFIVTISNAESLKDILNIKLVTKGSVITLIRNLKISLYLGTPSFHLIIVIGKSYWDND